MYLPALTSVSGLEYQSDTGYWIHHNLDAIENAIFPFPQHLTRSILDIPPIVHQCASILKVEWIGSPLQEGSEEETGEAETGSGLVDWNGQSR